MNKIILAIMLLLSLSACSYDNDIDDDGDGIMKLGETLVFNDFSMTFISSSVSYGKCTVNIFLENEGDDNRDF